jgi:electron transport complex protein RnfG
MAKTKSSLLNMLLTLVLVTAISGLVLGFVYEATKGPIEKSKLAKKNRAIENVVPAFDNQPVSEKFGVPIGAGDTIVFYPAKKGGEIVGYAIETYTKKAFSGKFKLMVGLLPDGTINNIAVLEHKETPGLGDKMEKKKSDWSVQFNGKHPDTFKIMVKKDGGDVDAITASTISSRAYCDAVMRAYNAFKKGGKK